MAEPLDRVTAALAARYAIQREIGSGGMATVYLAEDLRHHRKVAVKVLRPELAATLGPERFSREVEIAAQLQHPHILPLLDSGDAGGFLFYVMPFVEGESLRERLTRQGELPAAEAGRLLAEIADALAHAHARGVVHRDIKPDNVLLSGRHALVTDFGVAKAVSEATGRHHVTTAGVTLGTPAYMAPEQATADPHTDHRADIYALGVLGYELLAGAPPFTGPNAQTVLAAHVTQAPTPVSERRAGVPAQLEEVVMRCLAKRPADRWQSAQEIVDRLESLATPSGGVAPTLARVTSATPAAARSRATLWAGLAGAAVALAVVAVLAMQRRETPALALGRATQVTFDEGLELDPAISPDGKLIAYGKGPTGAMRLFVRQLGAGPGGGQAVALTADSGSSQRAPRWSPDGASILYGAGDAVYQVPALGGRPRLVARSFSTWAAPSAAWAPDGRRFIVPRGDTLVVHEDGGDERVLAIVPGSLMHSFAWSPDGSSIAYVAGNPDFAFGSVTFGNIGPSAIWIVPAGGGEPLRVTDASALNTSPVWLPDSRTLLFISNRDGPRDVYRVTLRRAGDPAGPVARLTFGLGAHSISLTADGGRMAYSVYRPRSNVWAVALAEEGVASMAAARQITTGNQMIETFVVTHDGKWIYFDSDRSGNQDLYRVPSTGGEVEQLTTDPGDDFLPDVSRDGRSVVFHGVRQSQGGRRVIIEMPAAGGPERVVAAGPWQNRFAHWSPDGQAVCFSVTEAPATEAGVYVVRRGADGSWGTPRKVFAGVYWAWWWPDGRSLLVEEYNVRPTPEDEPLMMRVPLDGGAPIPIATEFDSAAITIYAVPTPDGRNIAIKPVLPNGVSGAYLLPATGGRARLMLRLDRQEQGHLRWTGGLRGKMFYELVEDRQSDVFVAELGSPRAP